MRSRTTGPAPGLGVTLSSGALALVLSSCAPAPPVGEVAAPPGSVLRVGTSGDYPPFSLAGHDLGLEGFDVELAARFALDLGRGIEWVPFRWPELSAAVERGAFDVAMSGVTWRPERAVTGWMSRAVAAGGPCVVARTLEGLERPLGVAVNRGGILERWAREHLEGVELMTVDDNLRLPELLRGGQVDAFVTDSFEVEHFGGAWPRRCEPHGDRKVYWITPAGGEELAEQIDAWLSSNEEQLRQLRLEHFGEPQPRDELDHLIDLLARRLAFMPAVAVWKRAHGLPIEDRERERRVLASAEGKALASGLEPESVEELFRVQIELAKAVQRRAEGAEPTLELEQIRPVLLRLGDAVVESLGRLAPLSSERLTADRFGPLAALLHEIEIARLRRALLAIARRETVEGVDRGPVALGEQP